MPRAKGGTALRARSVAFVAVLVTSAIRVSAGEAAWDAPKPVKLKGITSACSYANSYLAWMTQARKDRPAGLLVRDGDPLYVERKPEKADADKAAKEQEAKAEGVYLYRASDGAEVSLAAAESWLKLGADIIYLQLADKPEPWAWLEKADRETLAKVRVAHFGEKVDDVHLPLVKKLAEANPAIGLNIEDPALAKHVLPLFRTRQLLNGEFLLGRDAAELLPCLADVEFLVLDIEKETKNLGILAKLPRLRTLVLGGYEPLANGPLPAGMDALRSLTLAGGKLEDLVPAAHLTGLEELRVHGCESLAEIDSVGALANLKALSFGRCEKLASLAILGKLKGLKELGLPTKTAQEQFATATREHPGLQLLELVGCKGVDDLSPLRDLRELRGLVLVGVPAGRAPLRDAKSLRFLALDGEVFDGSPEDVAALEKALPQCVVVEGGGMCLGSGWILLLLPAAAAAWLVARRRRRRACHA